MCEGDLIVKPRWRAFGPQAAMGDGDLTAALLGKACHRVIVKGVGAKLDSAERTLVDRWTLYTSNRAYRPCNPFLNSAFDPNDSFPSPHPHPH